MFNTRDYILEETRKNKERNIRLLAIKASLESKLEITNTKINLVRELAYPQNKMKKSNKKQKEFEYLLETKKQFNKAFIKLNKELTKIAKLKSALKHLSYITSINPLNVIIVDFHGNNINYMTCDSDEIYDIGMDKLAGLIAQYKTVITFPREDAIALFERAGVEINLNMNKFIYMQHMMRPLSNFDRNSIDFYVDLLGCNSLSNKPIKNIKNIFKVLNG